MPRPSTSRARALPYRGHRHYFHAPPGRRAWWIRAAVVATVAVAGAAGWFVLFGPGRNWLNATASHGPLARAHSTLDGQCDACHVPHGESGGAAGALLSAGDRWRTFRCDGCHPGSCDGSAEAKTYAPHYRQTGRPDLKPDPVAGDCSSCHRDHQGRDVALDRVPDSACVRCHANPGAYHLAGPPAGVVARDRPVGDFSGHPEFRPVHQWATAGPPNPRTLKFSHALHLTPGIVRTPEAAADRNHVRTLGQFTKKTDKDRYRPFTANGRDEDLIGLTCVACHELDAGRAGPRAVPGRPDEHPLPPAARGLPAAALAPPRAAGEFYLPVVFEKHCQACHGLEVSGIRGDQGLTLATFTVPHRYQPADLETYVRGEVARQVFDARDPARPGPAGGDRLDPLPSPPVDPTLRGEVDGLVRRVTEFLYDLPAAPRGPAAGPPGPPPPDRVGGYQCRKCHDVQPGPTPFDPPSAVVRPASPVVWLAAGRFDHAAHRAFNCKSCHPGQVAAYPPAAKRVAKEPLGIPGVATCQQCHSPAGGVRHGCVDCHQYHGADRPLQGRGAVFRDLPPERRMDIDAFLGRGR